MISGKKTNRFMAAISAVCALVMLSATVFASEALPSPVTVENTYAADKAEKTAETPNLETEETAAELPGLENTEKSTELPVSENVEKGGKFNDISGHWAESTINKWGDNGIISGYPDGTFRPDEPVTRAELAKILTSAFDLQEKTALSYDDVKAEDWYYPYLESCAEYIPIYPLPVSYPSNLPYQEVSGKNLNYFLPETAAMRMHVAEALVEIKKDRENLNAELPTIQIIKDILEANFKDDDYKNLYPMHGEIPQNVKRMFEYSYLANKFDIIKGDPYGYFRPYADVTRAELLTMLDRIIQTENEKS